MGNTIGVGNPALLLDSVEMSPSAVTRHNQMIPIEPGLLDDERP